MNQLNIRSGILFAIFAVLALTSATAHAATLNVTVTDAQSGEKLDRISITVIPQTGDSQRGNKRRDGRLSIRGICPPASTPLAPHP